MTTSNQPFSSAIIDEIIAFFLSDRCKNVRPSDDVTIGYWHSRRSHDKFCIQLAVGSMKIHPGFLYCNPLNVVNLSTIGTTISIRTIIPEFDELIEMKKL